MSITSPLLVKKEEYGPLVSPQRNRCTPIYNWHAFKHSFSKELVENLINEFNLEKGSWVLDPFSGGGTTLLACKDLGINSMGYDILPFSVFLSNVKTRDYDEKKLRKCLQKFRNFSRTPCTKIELPDISIVDKAFEPKVKQELILVKQMINEIQETETRDFFMLGLLSILEAVSNTSKSGGFLRIVKRQTPVERVCEIFFEKIESMISDIEESNKVRRNRKGNVKAFLGDSRKLPTTRKFHAVITSPPYPNRHDYTRIYALELIFDFVESNDELKEIRYHTLRSHVEARKKYKVDGYSKPAIIDDLMSQVESQGTNNPAVTKMLKGYFEDMYLSLSEMSRCLKDDGKIGLVVSNVRFSGVNIPVDEILAGIGEQVGLSTEGIWMARRRGNSSQQMKEFKRKPSRESIIIWQKV